MLFLFFLVLLLLPLLLPDITSSDPYVCVEDGRREWHRTGVISKSLNPVWTLSTGSLFLIQTTLNDFFESANLLEFVVKDYDSVGENDILGSALIRKDDLLRGDGERVEYPLTTTHYEGKSLLLVGNKKVRDICCLLLLLLLLWWWKIVCITNKVRDIFVVVMHYAALPLSLQNCCDIKNLAHHCAPISNRDKRRYQLFAHVWSEEEYRRA